MTSAKILKDSISKDGNRVTTFELEYPRFILSEVNTHRCIVSTTKILMKDESGSHYITVGSLFEKFNTFNGKNAIDKLDLYCVNTDADEVYFTKLVDIWKTDRKEVFEISTYSGEKLTLTRDHLIYCGNGKYADIDHLNLLDSVCVYSLERNELYLDKITSIKYAGIKDVYDLSVKCEDHNFIANNIVVHNCFSRNSASSRAIPIDRMIDHIENNMPYPIWTLNQSGMQGRILDSTHLDDASIIVSSDRLWKEAFECIVKYARSLQSLGIHKQNVNRLLEPWQTMKTILTTTDFENFFMLRIHEAAMPEIRELAICMKDVLDKSTPTLLNDNQWHLPYIDYDVDWDNASDVEKAKKISSSCCAQVSYRRLDTSEEKALQIFDRLVGGDIAHYSAFEHVCRPMNDKDTQWGNLIGWHQYRQDIDYERKSRGLW